jgi:MFS family permease
MNRRRTFFYITAADFLVRSAYQMGKTPLLPIFAAALGATDAFLGVIVSVSTLTGMLLKPVIGVFSDRWGRRNWLIAGTLFFVIMPFSYRFVHTPEMLFGVRIIHGLATAIYGPVTLAYVAEHSSKRRAENLGWFGLARSAGYIVGPAAAGWMLLTMAPMTIFTIIGLLSCAAFLPVLALPESEAPESVLRLSLRKQLHVSLQSSSRTPAIWLSGTLEAATYVALYAIKAFLPVYALAIGVNVAIVGTFFAFQEVIYMIMKPTGGRLGDRRGYLRVISVGMLVLGIALLGITRVEGILGLMMIAMLMGVAQALVFPSTTALVSTQIDGANLGAGMGFIGAFGNAGKVIGPVLGGLLIQRLDYVASFQLLGLFLAAGALLIWGGRYFLPRFGLESKRITRASQRHPAD